MDQKITCVQCKHWQVFDEASIKKFSENPERFDCELCHHGHSKEDPRFIGHYHACGFCQQVSKSDFCGCEESLEGSISTIKIVYPDMKNPGRVNEAEEASKTNRMVNKIIRNKKLEAIEREIRMDKNLQRLVELMEARVGV